MADTGNKIQCQPFTFSLVLKGLPYMFILLVLPQPLIMIDARIVIVIKLKPSWQ
jgi:hypothetical protein